MCVDGVGRHAKPVGDLSVGRSVSDKFEHAEFGRSEAVPPGLLTLAHDPTMHPEFVQCPGDPVRIGHAVVDGVDVECLAQTLCCEVARSTPRQRMPSVLDGAGVKHRSSGIRQRPSSLVKRIQIILK